MGRHTYRRVKGQGSRVKGCVAMACALCIAALSGCAPTYPKDKIDEAIVDLCKREYNLDVDTKIKGKTIGVYLPVDNLFDVVFNLDQKASKKINDVILGVSRVTLSTDAKFDFYVVVAQDPKVPEVEIVYIRYVHDVKRFLLGDISRGEYAKKALIAIKTPPQAERERILRELFSKLNIDDADEMIKEYLEGEDKAYGIGEISYWNKKFFINDITLAEFAAKQIEERIKFEFRENKDLNKWYEFKSVEGKFIKAPSGNRFVFNVSMANRVEPLYLDSGIELGSSRKRQLVFQGLVTIAGNVLWAYKFDDFERVDIAIPEQRLKISRDTLWKARKGKVKIGELL